MVERIQHAKIEDVSVAHRVQGDSEPGGSQGPIYFSNSEREWQIPETRTRHG